MASTPAESGPQTSHPRFNPGGEPAITVRIASGFRTSLQKALADAFPLLWFEAPGAVASGPES